MTRAEADLASMQRALADWIRGATTPGEPAEALVGGSSLLTPAMQVAIYREQFVLRHVAALRDDFLSLASLLGDEAFDRLANAYVQAFPPRSFTLRDLGRHLAEFVARTRPWCDDLLLADLARVEWAFIEAFDAPDAPALALASVASIPEEAWPSSRVVLQPSLQRLALAYPAHDLRLSAREASSACTGAARPAPRASHVVVFRGASGLQCLAIEPEAYALLDELARGAPLGVACERAAASSGAAGAAFEQRFEAKLGLWFQQWTALGWLSRVERG